MPHTGNGTQRPTMLGTILSRKETLREVVGNHKIIESQNLINKLEPSQLSFAPSVLKL